MSDEPKKKATPADSTGWNTPGWLFKFLDDKYHFTLDAAASIDNAKCDQFFTKKDNAFTKVWKGRVFINPPYGDKEGPSTTEWVEMGHRKAEIAELVCQLVPLKADTNFYHDYIRRGELVKEERFIDPRGKEGIYQLRRSKDFGGMEIESYEFRQRIEHEDDQGNTSGAGWFASVALVYRRVK